MGIKDRILNVFSNEEEFEENETVQFENESVRQEETVVRQNVEQQTSSQNVTQPHFNTQQANSVNSDFSTSNDEEKDANLILFEPTNFREAREIGEFIKSNTAVCLNLSSIEPEEGKRIMDFVSGVIFALDGKFTKAASGVFICAPKNIGVAGKISSNAGQAQENLKKW